jgi:peptidoglycan/LPS O-acetylase OafA/YrhL
MTNKHGRIKDAGAIHSLTALRFFAALWVVLFSYWPKLAGADVPSIVERGYLGVELFFILSGFILCHVYLRGFGEQRFSYGSFLWNRLARIYPLHLATCLGLIGLALAAGLAGIEVDASLLDWRSLPANLALLHAWGFAPTSAFNHPSWSISAEAFAYLSFPLFAAVAWRLRNKPWLFLGVAVGVAAVLYPLFQAAAGFSLTLATIRWGALRIVPCFLLGCALHSLWRSGATRTWNCGLLALAFLAGAAVLTALGAPDLLTVLCLGGLILSLAGTAEQGGKLLTQRPLTYLGEISYSIYMVCVPWEIVFVNGAARALGLPDEKLPLWLWIVFVLGVIPLAAASYHLIEKPAREAMKSWAAAHRQRRLVTATEG